jgi:hypothetical protein
LNKEGEKKYKIKKTQVLANEESSKRVNSERNGNKSNPSLPSSLRPTTTTPLS